MFKLSILLTIYNNKNNAIIAVKSVFEQTYTNWELIIIDDCSTDGLAAVLEPMIKNNHKVRFVRNESNVGRYISLNEGLLRAKGNYIAIIDSYDKYEKNKIEEQVKILDNNSNIVAVLALTINNNKTRFAEDSIMYRKSIIEKIGYYDSVRLAANSEFLLRITHVFGEKSIYKINKILNHSSNKNFKGKLKERIMIKRYMKKCNLWLKEGKDIYIDFPLAGRPFDIPHGMV